MTYDIDVLDRESGAMVATVRVTDCQNADDALAAARTTKPGRSGKVIFSAPRTPGLGDPTPSIRISAEAPAQEPPVPASDDPVDATDAVEALVLEVRGLRQAVDALATGRARVRVSSKFHDAPSVAIGWGLVLGFLFFWLIAIAVLVIGSVLLMGLGQTN